MSIQAVTTALVLIDLQNSNVARQLAPHSSADVVERSIGLAEKFRKAGGTVVFVTVLANDLLSFDVDTPFPRPSEPTPPSASELCAAVQPSKADILITKRQWGAFYGTPLDQLLRRRGVTTIVLGGIATNFGVESTARAAMDLGYELLFVEDAMSSISETMHRFTVENLFPKIGRVRSAEQISLLLDQAP